MSRVQWRNPSGPTPQVAMLSRCLISESGGRLAPHRYRMFGWRLIVTCVYLVPRGLFTCSTGRTFDSLVEIPDTSLCISSSSRLSQLLVVRTMLMMWRESQLWIRQAHSHSHQSWLPSVSGCRESVCHFILTTTVSQHNKKLLQPEACEHFSLLEGKTVLLWVTYRAEWLMRAKWPVILTHSLASLTCLLLSYISLFVLAILTVSVKVIQYFNYNFLLLLS